MEFYKFNLKSDALLFCASVNNGEGYIISNNTTTGYVQPVEYFGIFYVVSDAITDKYATDTPINVDSVDYNPPTLLPYAVEIPEIYQWAFPEDKFVLSFFEIPLDTYNNLKVVNLAYFQWAEFRAELDSGNYEALKRSLMPLWDYVAEQVTNNNIIVL
jgi:hypothetical protein